MCTINKSAYTKKVWKLIVDTSYIYIYIYICVCVCVCVCGLSLSHGNLSGADCFSH